MERNMWKKESSITAVAIVLFLISASLSASATTISVSDVFLKPDENAVTSIIINNVSNLGVADISLTFDPSKVHVLSADNSDFDFFLVSIINSTGVIRAGGIEDDVLNGNVKLADITLKSVGNHGETSALSISINELKEAGPPPETPIPATVDNGTAFINLPPVAIPIPVHRYNNVGTDYPCKALFNASASYDPDNDNITSYDWDFGDGYSGEGQMTEHAYSTYKWNGTGYEPFDACLTVKDEWGLANTAIIQVNVCIPGDANGDGWVDIFDSVLLGREWNKNCGEHQWTERRDRADLNNDCWVDIFDAVIIGANWGDVAW